MPTSPKKLILEPMQKKLFPFGPFYLEHIEEFDSVSKP